MTRQTRNTTTEKRGVRAIASAVVLVALLFLLCRVSPAQTTQPVTSVQRWFDELAHTESGERAEERTALLGLKRTDLETLREVVRKSAPLAPAQAAVLHDIVVHVYLSGEHYEGDPTAGFLGVRRAEDRGLPLPDVVDQSGPVGALINECLPGFCGYRWLRPGDLVSGILVGDEMQRVPTWEDLVSAVSTTPPGKTLQLRVVRQGREVKVSLQLNAKPLVAADKTATEQWLGQRTNDAEEYWKKTFVPVTGEVLSRLSPVGHATHRRAPSNTRHEA